jgi:hypothetical protein
LYANELDTLLLTYSSLLISNGNYDVVYVRTQTNGVADNVVRTSLFKSSSSTTHHYYSPDCISFILLNEIEWFHFASKKEGKENCKFMFLGENINSIRRW